MCTLHTIAFVHAPRLHVLGGAGHCSCGYVVLTPCARLALDEFERASIDINQSAGDPFDPSSRQLSHP